MTTIQSKIADYIQVLKNRQGSRAYLSPNDVASELQGILEETKQGYTSENLPHELVIFGRPYPRDTHPNRTAFVNSYSFHVGHFHFKVVFNEGKWVGRLLLVDTPYQHLICSSVKQQTPEEAMLHVYDFLQRIAGHIK